MTKYIAVEEKALCVVWLAELKCVADVRRKYTTFFTKEAPRAHSINGWMKKFLETGSVNDKPRSGRPKLKKNMTGFRKRVRDSTDEEEEEDDIASGNENTDSTLLDFSPVCKDVLAEKPKINLRNIKFRARPAINIKTENIEPEVHIKKELPDGDCFVYNGITEDKPMQGLPGCSTSDVDYTQPTDLLAVKLENVKTEDDITPGRQQLIVADMPVKCMMQETFTCEYCPFTTSYERKFNRHVSVHYLQKQYSCELCPYITKHRGDLLSHMLTHTKIKRLTCEFCPFQSRTKGEFREHILTHTQPFKCQVCLYETDSESLLSTHMTTCCVLMRPKKRDPLC